MEQRPSSTSICAPAALLDNLQDIVIENEQGHPSAIDSAAMFGIVGSASINVVSSLASASEARTITMKHHGEAHRFLQVATKKLVIIFGIRLFLASSVCIFCQHQFNICFVISCGSVPPIWHRSKVGCQMYASHTASTYHHTCVPSPWAHARALELLPSQRKIICASCFRHQGSSP